MTALPQTEQPVLDPMAPPADYTGPIWDPETGDWAVFRGGRWIGYAASQSRAWALIRGEG